MAHCEFLGWKLYSFQAFPQVLDASLLYRVEFEEWESALPHNVEFHFLDAEDNAFAQPAGMEIEMPVGRPEHHFTYNLSLRNVVIKREGEYHIEVYLDSKLVKTLRFRVRLAQVPAQSPAPLPAAV